MHDEMEAKNLVSSWEIETAHTYSNDPPSLVSLFCLLEWLAMKGVYWWMTMALTEWQPESHALLKNVSPACLLSSKIVWEAECQDTLVMHDHELVMKWPEIWRKLEKNILWIKDPENGHVFFLFCCQPSPQICLLCLPGWMWCKFGRIIAI